MTKARCPNCKEFPYWRGAYNAAGEWGQECSLCRHVRIVKRRHSGKREQKRQKLECTLQELLQG